jgi:hypothetical protein
MQLIDPAWMQSETGDTDDDPCDCRFDHGFDLLVDGLSWDPPQLDTGHRDTGRTLADLEDVPF